MGLTGLWFRYGAVGVGILHVATLPPWERANSEKKNDGVTACTPATCRPSGFWSPRNGGNEAGRRLI
jgi:hypothetical protein